MFADVATRVILVGRVPVSGYRMHIGITSGRRNKEIFAKFRNGPLANCTAVQHSCLIFFGRGSTETTVDQTDQTDYS